MAVCYRGTDNLITLSVSENFQGNWTDIVLLIVLLISILAVYFLWKSRDRLKKIINQKTNEDALTGYSNFSQFLDDADYLLKFKEAHYAIGYIDINNFKSINDNYGRAQGDRVLKIVAEKINDLVVPNGIFAR
jgi:GGDEF domain-containing protein